MDLTRLREEYTQDGLTRKMLASEPFAQFEKWFTQAQETQAPEPNAMTLATCGGDGQPNVRTVLLKHIDASGAVFYTNLESNKALEIGDNPQVALLFNWLSLERQIKILGKAEKLSAKEAFQYFSKRPMGSQLGAWSSPQSRKITGRQFLEMQLAKMKEKFADGKIPLPSFWGGYRVRPHLFEFWQGRPNRLHDRFQYTRREDDTWQIDRLAP